MVKCGEYKLISVYCSPNAERDVFLKMLEDIGDCIGGYRGEKVIIGGDMNARSMLWDRKYNNRGFILEEWVDTKGLVVMNDGREDTCVRAQGSSRVDVTIATMAAAKEMRGWTVDVVAETLSDHKYITFRTEGKVLGEMGNRGEIFPRWKVKKCDGKWFDVSIVGGAWLYERKIRELTKMGETEKVDIILKRIITDACNNSMSRRSKMGGNGRNKIYWWNQEIAGLKGRRMWSMWSMWRRRLIRAKSRGNPEKEAQSAGELRAARKELRIMIGKAKRKAWDELLEGLNGDPWGRPYKGIINKMKVGDSNICQKLQGKVLGGILDKLFPKDREVNVFRGG